MDTPTRPLLQGAVVQRVMLTTTTAVLKVRSPGQTALVIVACGADGSNVGLLVGGRLPGDIRGGDAALAEKTRWRARLVGTRIEGLFTDGVTLRAPDSTRFRIEPTRQGPRLREGEDETASARPPLEPAAQARLEARGERLLAVSAADALFRRQAELKRALAATLTKLQRRIGAVQGDLARISEADDMAARAQLFVAEAARMPRGAREIAVTDWSTGVAITARMPLDPSRSARAQIDAMFRRARRLKLGAAIARARLDGALRAHAALEALAGEVNAAAPDQLDALAARARVIAPRDFALSAAATGRAKPGAPRLAFRTFVGASGARVFVGRGGAHNDALTLHVAKPHDLWLHAKGKTGAHVVVPLAKGRACPPDLLVEAAHLAAHFSDVRGEEVVEVQYTPRRYVRKPRGAAPGLVVVDREKVMGLRVDKAVLEALLVRETTGA